MRPVSDARRQPVYVYTEFRAQGVFFVLFLKKQ